MKSALAVTALKIAKFLQLDGRALVAVVLLLAYAALLTVLVFIYRAAVRRHRGKTEAMCKILSAINPDHDLDKNLTDFLGLIVPLVKADAYCFYVLDSHSNEYALKSVRFNDTESLGLVEPSYSGLSPYQKERYNPPLRLPHDQAAGFSPIKMGEVPVLVLPVKGGAGLITVGPLKRVNRRTRKLLQYLTEHLAPAIDVTMVADKMRKQVNAITASNEAIRSLAKSTSELDGSLAVLMGLSIKIIDAAGGGVIFREQGHPDLVEVSGMDAEDERLFLADHGVQKGLFELLGGREMVIIDKKIPEYADLPVLFAAIGTATLIISGITGRRMTGLAFFWFKENHGIESHRVSTLQMLVKRMGEAFDRQLKFRQISNSYLEMLKMLVDTVDNMETHSVSHSELICRYAGIIAGEMGLTREEIKEVMLAGYLHDVGSLGLSADILFKEGRYTEVEQETMKLHAEVGASIIESTIANNKVASYIRHHHERWDGNGYPGGLKGEEIPLGARIISVVDMLNAKLAGRKNRSPVSFPEAIDSLRAASGTQLDPEVTRALVNWFNKKRLTSVTPHKSLGRCWEMRCCPPSIAQTCPSFGKTDTNCWENEGVKCSVHGNTCATCAVYTEYVHRTDQLRGSKL